MDESGHHRRRNRNPPSSHSSSFTGTGGFRRRELSSHPTKSSNSVSSTSTSSHNNSRDLKQIPNWKHRRNSSQEEKGEEGGTDDSFTPVIGTCPFMCPEGERTQRERLRDLAVFERLNGDPRKTSPDLAVKKFCRTISNKYIQASDVRPLPVLEDTLKYLLNLLDSSNHPFEVVHDFIFDRTRSIRQDLSMQNIANERAIHMYEEMVKFHIISHLKLQSCSGSNISSLRYLNMEQLTKALASLYNLYDLNRNVNSVFENEAEFRSFYVLLHLDSRSQPMGESLSLWLRLLPSSIIKSKEMCFSRRVLRYFRMGNYKSFFCTIAGEASYLQYCIMKLYIGEVRALAISYINNCCYKLHPYPLTHLSKLLMMKESDMESLCNACGLETLADESGNKLLPTKQTTFCIPKEGFQSYDLLGLQEFER
ncbi:hypothetical protein SLE2022_066740 [Rubroshorea leprosula]